jgi:hypothetical protein
MHRAPQLRENGFEVGGNGLHAFGFRAHTQQVLLEVEIQGEGARQAEGKARIIISG